MKATQLIICFISFMLLPTLSDANSSYANQDNEILTVDEYIPNLEVIEFPNDNYIFPEKSDFSLINTISMSNLIGERWATITVKNNSSGVRTFDQDHIIALFADGSRRFPLNFEKRVQGYKSLSILINFGTSQYPIIKLITRE